MNRVVVPEIKENIVFGDFDNPYSELPDKPTILNIYPVPDNPLYLYDEALKRDLSKVVKLRFDPINTCNMKCIFCPASFKGKPVEILPEHFANLISKLPSLKRLIFGCSYESTLSPNLSEYANSYLSVFNGELRPITSFVSNGLRLSSIDFDTYSKFVDWIHISIHSLNSDRFKELQKADLNKVVESVSEFRSKYPALRMHTEMVVNSINYQDALPQIEWIFNELKFNSMNLRRVEWMINDHQPNQHSHLYKTKQSGMDLSIDDKNWHKLCDDVLKHHKGNLSSVSLRDNFYRSDVIELTNINYPS